MASGRVLVLGGSGFIGSALVARLRQEGFRPVVASRRTPRDPGVEHLRIDIAALGKVADWLPHLAGIDAVINCAGLLQETPGESLKDVHEAGPAALFAACETAGVRRVIQLSALGAGPDAPTDFTRSKFAGDQALAARDLDWVILRPSVVIGRSAYGGSALLRGLASLPIQPRAPDAGAVQPIHIDDLVDTILFFLKAGAPSRIMLDLVGPRAWPFDDLVALFRRWLGWTPARRIDVPRWSFGLLYWMGDLAGKLGWRPPIRTTAALEIKRGSVGNPLPWTEATGIAPRDIADTFVAGSASVQERWFAQLYLIKPFMVIALVIFWIATGMISLGPGRGHGLDLMNEGGLFGWMATLAVIGGGLIDIIVGAAIAVRRAHRRGLQAGIAVSLLYGIAGTILLPHLWADPLAPLLKIAPIVALHLAALGMSDER